MLPRIETMYLSAGMGGRDFLRGVRYDITRGGSPNFRVTSSWLDEDESTTAGVLAGQSGLLRALAMRDYEDIDAADLFVMFTFWPSTSGGRYAELEYARMTKKPIVIVGALAHPTHVEGPFVHYAASGRGSRRLLPTLTADDTGLAPSLVAERLRGLVNGG